MCTITQPFFGKNPCGSCLDCQLWYTYNFTSSLLCLSHNRFCVCVCVCVCVCLSVFDTLGTKESKEIKTCQGYRLETWRRVFNGRCFFPQSFLAPVRYGKGAHLDANIDTSLLLRKCVLYVCVFLRVCSGRVPQEWNSFGGHSMLSI